MWCGLLGAAKDRKQLYQWETWFLTTDRNPTKLLDHQTKLG